MIETLVRPALTVVTIKSVGQEIEEYLRYHLLSESEKAMALSSVCQVMEGRRKCAEKDPCLGYLAEPLTLEEYGQIAIEQYVAGKLTH